MNHIFSDEEILYVCCCASLNTPNLCYFWLRCAKMKVRNPVEVGECGRARGGWQFDLV